MASRLAALGGDFDSATGAGLYDKCNPHRGSPVTSFAFVCGAIGRFAAPEPAPHFLPRDPANKERGDTLVIQNILLANQKYIS